MKWRIVVVLAFLVAALTIPATASASKEGFQFKGESASAQFALPDPSDPCIQTSTFVSATEGRLKEGSGKPEAVSTVFVDVFRYNSCTNETLVGAFGSTTLSAEAFQVNKELSAATLNATVEVCDFSAGNCFPVAINLSWAGTGEIVRNKSVSHSNSGGCKFFSRFLGDFRPAVATGSVTALGEILSPDPSTFADLASVRQGFTEINCP
jgi:hypothetical protein